MNKTLLFASIGILAVATSTLSLANAHEYREDPEVGALLGYEKLHMQLTSDTRKREQHADREGASDKREQTKGMHSREGVDQGMQAVPTIAGPGQPGDGWLYFSHPTGDRAVVISPKGEYYFSHGKGLRLVAVTQPRS